jgi:aryl-alcohol dehydrogenase-like predicted oxidoreductase
VRSSENRQVDQYGRPLFLDSDQQIVAAVEKIAKDRGVPMAQIGLAWVLRNPVVSAPIVGATKPQHLADAVAALSVTLTEDEVAALEQHYVPRLPTYYR